MELSLSFPADSPAPSPPIIGSVYLQLLSGNNYDTSLFGFIFSNY